MVHGIWKSVDSYAVNRYCVYDSISSSFVLKQDQGANFHRELGTRVRLDSNHIWWGVGNGEYDRWLWYKASDSLDTLALSYDSLLRFPMIYTRSKDTSVIKSWIENIPQAEISFYPSIIMDVQGLSYADSTWYVLCSTNSSDGYLHKVRVGDTALTSIVFPNLTAMDIHNEDLWIAKRRQLEKRSLRDTSLLEQFDLSAYFVGAPSYSRISGIAVTDEKIYLSCSPYRFMVISRTGDLITEDSTNGSLSDMMFVNGRLWGINRDRTIHEIDTLTGHALHTYYLAGGYLWTRFQGIAYRDGRIAAADFLRNSLQIWEVQSP